MFKRRRHALRLRTWDLTQCHTDDALGCGRRCVGTRVYAGGMVTTRLSGVESHTEHLSSAQQLVGKQITTATSTRRSSAAGCSSTACPVESSKAPPQKRLQVVVRRGHAHHAVGACGVSCRALLLRVAPRGGGRLGHDNKHATASRLAALEHRLPSGASGGVLGCHHRCARG